MSESMSVAAAPKQSVGIAFYVLAIFLLAAMDASAKWLTKGYPIGEIAFFRAVFAFVPLIIAQARERKPVELRSRLWPLHLLRGALVLGTVVTFFLSVKELPLATVTAISLANPFFMVLCSAILLKEPVSNVRWFLISLGFVGVLVAIGGVSLTASFYTAIAILSALLYALAAVLTKHLARTESAILIAAYTNVSMLVLSVFSLSSHWAMPGLHDFFIFALMGLAGGLSNYVFTLAFRYADVSTVAPIEYTILVWAALFGYVLFSEIPTALTIIGALIIVVSGIANARLRR
ncbi:DMT family transporter [Paraburkholderia ginsengisoli]|uniref:DMT family transporter n=1 Tax=Paraburkholderia ginsengisoli TaxID=311231 RepID=A0A7T4TCT0_9BURK|nr:DMT family transporter [Paraburkholderia ginsengisoli]QQC67893.1 DMT family transporter [Paraburkholderia ginsengisoli]